MKKKEPFIGITCDTQRIRFCKKKIYDLLCDERYPEAVKEAGGYPILLPIARRENVINRYLDQIDGVIIVGGADVEPRLYGEKKRKGTGAVIRARLNFERQLYAEARKRKLPVFGICYGMQLINVLEGGALFQDIRRDAGSPLSHRNRTHPVIQVTLERTSRLGKIIGVGRVRVHCEHHQAVSRVAPGFRPVAFAPDGTIEAIENPEKKILAVQWHPERTYKTAASRRLFRAFIEMC